VAASGEQKEYHQIKRRKLILFEDKTKTVKLVREHFGLSERGEEDMEDPKIKYDVFNPKPIGVRINVHVHRVAPEREPDYEAIQRFIKNSAQVLAKKTD
jgi:hypothetical protein